MTTAMDRFLQAAKKAGCPAEQLKNFRAGEYCAHQKALQFHAAARECDTPGGPTQVGVGGARGPGKSHMIFAQLALDDCRRADGIKALYIRKVGKQAREQMEDLRRKVLHSQAHEYKRHEGVVIFPNGSRVFVGHFKSEADIDNYLGLEYDVIAVEEATTLTSTKYQALRDSNRTSRDDWRPRIYASTNPGGVGHAWYKQRFIEPWRNGTEQDTRFIFGTVDDNPFVDHDYKRKLEENTGWRLRAYRYGDWDISAGQFFTTWQHDVHVVEPVPLQRHWRYWLALDYGFTHPTAAYLLAETDTKQVYVVDEHWQQKWLVPRHARAIHEMLARHNLTFPDLWVAIAGGDIFAKEGRSETTPAEQYAKHGIDLKRADMARINGAARVLECLGDIENGVKPKLYIFSRCKRLIECLPSLEHDPHRPEDVMKVDIDDDGTGGDDAYDALRYGLMELKRVYPKPGVSQYA